MKSEKAVHIFSRIFFPQGFQTPTVAHNHLLLKYVYQTKAENVYRIRVLNQSDALRIVINYSNEYYAGGRCTFVYRNGRTGRPEEP